MEKLDKKKEELVQEKKDTQTAVLLFCAFFLISDEKRVVWRVLMCLYRKFKYTVEM